jgi:hypothetical protein
LPGFDESQIKLQSFNLVRRLDKGSEVKERDSSYISDIDITTEEL